MRQKMWVRRHETWWEVGCQKCGHLVHEDWSWRWAMLAADWHIEHHRRRASGVRQ